MPRPRAGGTAIEIPSDILSIYQSFATLHSVSQ